MCRTAIPGVDFYIIDLEWSQEQQNQDGHILQQVSFGGIGEVYMGGPVMPEKMAEVFVPNPFDQDPSCPCLYGMRDLGRLLPNGPLEILGRCDFMVKIRGYSVVLGAIEMALAKHPRLLSSASCSPWMAKKWWPMPFLPNGPIHPRPPVCAPL
eukprot:scaffold313990_cov54-Attheya_sp.AAC.1